MWNSTFPQKIVFWTVLNSQGELEAHLWICFRSQFIFLFSYPGWTFSDYKFRITDLIYKNVFFNVTFYLQMWLFVDFFKNCSIVRLTDHLVRAEWFKYPEINELDPQLSETTELLRIGQVRAKLRPRKHQNPFNRIITFGGKMLH